jgi:glycerol uptake facilitator protein
MISPWLGEFLGTLILILLGDGVVAAVLLKKSKAEGSGWIVIATGWAFAVMCGVFTAIACGSSDAHLNPAVTLGFAVRAGAYGKFLPYLSAQLLGAIAGAALVCCSICRIGKRHRILERNWACSARARRFEIR